MEETMGEKIERVIAVCRDNEIPSGVIGAIADGLSHGKFIEDVLLWSDTDEHGTSRQSQQYIANAVLAYAVASPSSGVEWVTKSVSRFLKPSTMTRPHGDYHGGVIWGALLFLSWLSEEQTAVSFFRQDERPGLLDRNKYFNARNACASIIAEAIAGLPRNNPNFDAEKVGACVKTIVKKKLGGSEQLVRSLEANLRDKTSISSEAKKIIAEICFGRVHWTVESGSTKDLADLLKLP